MLIRRVRRVIGVRARAVHEALQPASYLILAHLDDERPGAGPRRSWSAFGIDKGAISRQVQHLSTSAWSSASRTPTTAGRAADGHRRGAPAGWRTSRTTGASGSTSSSATGPSGSSTTSWARWPLQRRRSTTS